MVRLKRFDNKLRRERGFTFIGGVDEAGRGALAGPVVAAIVVLGPEAVLKDVDDSKVLTPEKREALVPEILTKARFAALGLSTAEEIDDINILQATFLAARRAMSELNEPPELLVTDFLKIPNPPCEIMPIVDGDAKSLSVAAASVLAKVARDRIMTMLDGEFPIYGHARHKGYGTPEHWSVLNESGPSTLHRLTYNGVCWFNSEPGVRSRAVCDGRLPASRPPINLMNILDETPPADCVCAFLPEREFRGAVRTAPRETATKHG